MRRETYAAEKQKEKTRREREAEELTFKKKNPSQRLSRLSELFPL